MRTKIQPLTGSFIWKSLERFSVVGIQFFVQLILARILVPEDYGNVAVVSSVIAILNIPIQSGVVKALIQFKNINSKYFSVALWVNVFVSLSLYLLLLLLAPWLGVLTGIECFPKLAGVLGLTLILGAFVGIQESFFMRYFKYKQIFRGYLFGTIISALIAILSAISNVGLWALVYQQVSFWGISTIFLWIQSAWRPTFHFSINNIKKMIGYSWKIMISSFIDTAFFNAQSIAIGSIFNARNLGLINKGQQFPLLLTVNLDGIIQSVMLRDLSKRQDNLEDVHTTVKKVETICAFLLFPILGIMVFNARSIIVVLLSDRWIDSSKYLVLFCLAYMFTPLSGLNKQIPNALGKSSITLRNEIMKKIVGVILIGASLPFGLNAFCLALVGYGMVCYLIDAITTGYLIKYGVAKQFNDIAPYAILSIVMGVFTFPIRYLGFGCFMTLTLTLIVGVSLYLGLSHLLKLPGYRYARNLMRV